MHKSEIPTPALILDLDIFETSLERMATHVRSKGKQLRPHAKAHKCVEIAKRQIAKGAIGLCCATVPELELMAHAGITGLLLTSPLADPLKMKRAAATGAMVVVDHVQQVAWYDALGVKLDVLVDHDVGDHRTGVRSTEQALEVARAVAKSTNLTLRGLQAYSASGSHAGPDHAGREKHTREAFARAIATRQAMANEGLSTEILSGASTGTSQIDVDIPEVTELQCGSYVLMDRDYGRLGLPFGHALKALVTVVSANHESFVTTDGGFKSLATDRAFGPEAPAYPGSTYRWGGDEFGYLDVADCATKPKLGEKIELLPPHCDPTVNLHRRFWACRGDVVEAVWPIMG